MIITIVIFLLQKKKLDLKSHDSYLSKKAKTTPHFCFQYNIIILFVKIVHDCNL